MNEQVFKPTHWVVMRHAGDDQHALELIGEYLDEESRSGTFVVPGTNPRDDGAFLTLTIRRAGTTGQIDVQIPLGSILYVLTGTVDTTAETQVGFLAEALRRPR